MRDVDKERGLIRSKRETDNELIGGIKLSGGTENSRLEGERALREKGARRLGEWLTRKQGMPS